MTRLSAFAVALCTGATLFAQSAASPRGQWAGDIETPNGTKVGLVFDIDKTEKGWVGSMSVPAQKASGLPLGAIQFDKGELKFQVAMGGDPPSYAGKLSEDGKTIAGNFSQGGQAIALKLTYAGEPKVEGLKLSPAVAKEFVGEWEGTLEGPGLRLNLKITNEEGGSKAVLTSIDQGGTQIPATSLTQKDSSLAIEVRAVNGSYRATINKEGNELKGDWTQRDNSLPLNLKKKP